MAKLNDSKYSLKNISDIIFSYGYNFLDSEYKNVATKFNMSDFDGYLYFINFNTFSESIIKGHGIRKFGNCNPYTLENIKNWLKINNKNFTLISDHYISASNKLFFNCKKCNNNFDISWDNILAGQNCPYCAKNGKRISNRNSFYVNYPELVREWDFENNKNINIEKISYGSDNSVWWICPKCSYHYEENISSRTIGGQGCLSCANKVVTDKNRLSILYPDICLDWSYDKNDKLPSEYSYGSNKKVYWHCNICFNDYLAIIANKTLRSQGCPFCGMSKNVRLIYNILKNNNILFDIEHIFDDLLSDFNIPLRYDLGIFGNLSGNIVSLIEYDDIQHEKFIPYFHKTDMEFNNAMRRDEMKNIYAKNNNIPLLRITYKDENIKEKLLSFIEKCGIEIKM